VEDALGAHAAGAAIVHIHVRDPETGQPSADPKLFGEILSEIKSACNVVVCTTTGGGIGQTTAERVRVVKTYSPELASLNAGSLNFALFPIQEKIKDFKWSVCAAGKERFRMCNLALLMGGSTRVGLENNLYLEKGVMAKSSAEQVEKIIRIGKEYGLEPATPDEAREILSLKGKDKVNF
jgi:uncharacterized protein (DUF849 family)